MNSLDSKRSPRPFSFPLTAALAVAVFAVFSFLTWQDLGGRAFIVFFDDAMMTLVPAAVGALGVLRSRRTVEPRDRRGWFWLGLSSLSFSAGMVVWDFLQVAYPDHVPYPSLGDVGFLAAIPLAGYGMACFAKVGVEHYWKLKAVLDALLIASAMFVIAWDVVLRVLYNAGGQPVLNKVVGLAYPTLYFGVVALLVFLAGRIPSRSRKCFWLNLTGIFGLATVNVPYSLFCLNGSYYTGHPIDSLWIASFAALGLAAAWYPRSVPAEKGSGAPIARRITLFFPYLPVLGVGVVWINGLRAGQVPDAAMGIGTVACVILLTARQFVAILDYHLLARNLERRVAERTADLARSESRYRLLAENVADVIWTADLDLRYTFVSPSIVRQRGFDPHDYLGKSITDTLPAEASRRVAEAVRVGRSRLESIGDWPPLQLELETRRKDGSPLWIESRITPIVGSSGRVEGLVGVSRDISERRKSDAEKLQLEAQLHQSQKMEAVGRLAGGVAHDFNNILTAIFGYCNLLQNSLSLHDPLQEDVKEIEKAAQRASDMIGQLLSFSRRQVVSPRVIDLNAVLALAEKMLRRLIGEDVHLRMNLSPSLWNIRIDPHQVDQIVMNLAVNARDAMPTGGELCVGTANVRLDGTFAAVRKGLPEGDYVVLTVSDTGCGIPLEVQQKIFEPFFTTKGLGQGTGLGLATVYAIMQQYHGYIDVESRLQKGTSFRLYFAREEAGLTQPELVPEAPRPAREKGVVLVAEDDAIVRMLMEKVLRETGYTVLSAPGGREAAQVAENFEGVIHLLLTDIIMPGMNGKELYRKLKAERPDIRALFVSGYTGNTLEHYGILKEGLNFLAKPFTSLSLLDRVREILQEP